MIDDSSLYTGVDGENGVFGNEFKDEKTERLLSDQKKQLAELTPKLQSIVDMIENERKIALEYIADYVDNTKDSEEVSQIELKATGRYRKYLAELQTKFVLALKETKK
jgi:hypothetical protein